jgi:hypothetical protein
MEYRVGPSRHDFVRVGYARNRISSNPKARTSTFAPPFNAQCGVKLYAPNSATGDIFANYQETQNLRGDR